MAMARPRCAGATSLPMPPGSMTRPPAPHASTTVPLAGQRDPGTGQDCGRGTLCSQAWLAMRMMSCELQSFACHGAIHWQCPCSSCSSVSIKARLTAREGHYPMVFYAMD
eukprot:gene12974-biopygen6914